MNAHRRARQLRVLAGAAAVAATAVAAGIMPQLMGAASASTVPGTYSVVAGPTTAVAGSTANYKVIYTAGGDDVMTQVNLAMPGFSLRAASTPTLGWSAFFTSQSSLVATGASAPGQTVEVDVTATAPKVAGTSKWNTSASGLVNGTAMSGGFTNTGPNPVVTVNAGPAALLSFVQQPTDTPEGVVMSPAVVVSESDQFGNPTSLPVTLSTTAVSTDQSNLPQTASPVNGRITFSGLQLDAVGTGDTLVATAGSLTKVSQAFAVTGAASSPVVVTCPPNERLCTSPLVGSPSNTQTQLVDAPPSGDTQTDTVNLADDTSVAAPSACAPSAVTSIESAGSLQSNDPGRTLLSAFDVPGSIRSVLGGGASQWVLCYRSSSAFKDVNGVSTTQGVLPSCPSANPALAAPCVASVALTAGGGNGVRITLYAQPGNAAWVALPSSLVP